MLFGFTTTATTSATYLGHVLGDDVEAAPLLHDYPEQLHQVVVPQLPESRKHVSGIQPVIKCVIVFIELQGISRHDGGLGDESLRRGVIFDALDRHLVPSVVSHQHV